MTALLASLLLTGAVQFDLPGDEGPMGGATMALRWKVLPETTLGALLGWSLGGDDTNPESVRLFQRSQALALIGLTPLGSDSRLRVEARAGLSHLSNWPFGALSRRTQFSPTVGAGIGGGLPLGECWGHPMFIDLSGSYDTFRVGDEWMGAPGIAIGLTGQLMGHDD
jgi:hypothetical protein